MNISLIPAEAVPQTFEQRMAHREDDEAAHVTTMSAQFDSNSVIDSLVRYGRPDDIFSIDYYGHWHGARPAPLMHIPNGRHKRDRDNFRQSFPGSYVIMGGPPYFNLTNSTILNRSHIKAYNVGSRVLSFGGVNCVEAAYNQFIDGMLDLESEGFTAFLKRYAENGGNFRKLSTDAGEKIRLDEHNQILIDYGQRKNRLGISNKSVIFDSLMDDLEDIYSARISSTSIPHGKLDGVLSNHIDDGKNVEFYTNHPAKFKKPANASGESNLQSIFAMLAKTPWTDNRPDKFNHWKAIVIKKPDGQRIAYMGSSNWDEMHIWAGTAEACLRTTDDAVIDQIEAYMQDELVSSGSAF
jgi:hypothetical protein